MMRLPKQESWSLGIGDQSSKGNDWRGLVNELAASTDRPTPISLTFLLEMDGPQETGFDRSKQHEACNEPQAWIQRVRGRKFPLDIPDPDQIDIEDITHALGMLVRFNGHCTKFYSVAEPSVHVSYEVAPERQARRIQRT